MPAEENLPFCEPKQQEELDEECVEAPQGEVAGGRHLAVVDEQAD